MKNNAHSEQFFNVAMDWKATTCHRTFLEYLCLSPSYELARKHNAKSGLSDKDKLRVPSDFDKVLATYDLLGDIRKLSFEGLFAKCGREVFGDLFTEPRVQEVIKIPADVDISQYLDSTLWRNQQNFLSNIRQLEGQPPAVLLHLPLNISKAETMRQLEALVDGSKTLLFKSNKNIVEPKIRLSTKRVRMGALINGLRLIRAKAFNPNLEQWKLGAITNLSKTHSARAQKNLDHYSKGDDDKFARSMMYRITHRALKKAEYTAENAARGNFPLYSKIDTVDFDYKEVRRMTEVRIRGLLALYPPPPPDEPDDLIYESYCASVEDFSYLQS